MRLLADRPGGRRRLPEYVSYHDEEWGTPLHGDDALFERLCLEAFQSGLSWITILRKRPAFRAAFAGFSIDAVAAFTDEDEARLMADAGIVRNRAKVAAAIRNARAAQRLPDGLDALLWSFAPALPRPRPATLADVPATSAESTAMAKELKRPRLRVRRADHRVRAHAGHRDGRRPRRRLLPSRLSEAACRPVEGLVLDESAVIRDHGYRISQHRRMPHRGRPAAADGRRRRHAWRP